MQELFGGAGAGALLITFCGADGVYAYVAGWYNVGWRNSEMRTPAIDALAASGIV